ncbi:MAG: signal recognition particle-docking protein FtsY [Clostridia bacterium]|nr:signal recognition particle-docking protein FtsY [Clostridia bacterium]
MAGLFTRSLDEDFFEALEESLILADVGVNTALEMVEELRAVTKQKKITSPELAREALAEIAEEKLGSVQPDFSGPCLILVVGVNGAGKTTTIARLSQRFKMQGRKVMMVAGDTFRAAASEQLGQWAQRTEAQFVRGSEGSDPAAVIFDGINAARARQCDIVLCDTAGRLHSRKNLMEELKKIHSVAAKGFIGKVLTMLVLDATMGLNGLEQARVFDEAIKIDGITLTKLDGTAKGGVVLAVSDQLGIPVWFCGVGEKEDDLQPFDANAYAHTLFK